MASYTEKCLDCYADYKFFVQEQRTIAARAFRGGETEIVSAIWSIYVKIFVGFCGNNKFLQLSTLQTGKEFCCLLINTLISTLDNFAGMKLTLCNFMKLFSLFCPFKFKDHLFAIFVFKN